MSGCKAFRRSAALFLFSTVATWLSGVAPVLADPVDLSAVPLVTNTSVAPNVVMTFDDSGSMSRINMGDNRPFDGGSWNGPWHCAGVIDPAQTTGIGALPMNGVYYNPHITYTPPQRADGTAFPNADASLRAVWQDGIAVNRPQSPAAAATATYADNPGGSSTSTTGATTDLMGTVQDRVLGTPVTKSGSVSSCPSSNDQRLISNCSCGRRSCTWTETPILSQARDDRWQCGTPGRSGSGEQRWSASRSDQNPLDGKDGKPNGGPLYFRFKNVGLLSKGTDGKLTADSLTQLYTSANWEAVPVPADQYQNFANWYAYYRTRSLMARSSMSRAFDKVGEKVRVTWQNINSNLLSSTAEIYPLANVSASSGAGRTWRNTFFDWIFKTPANDGTPNREAVVRAGEFFRRGSSTTRNATNPYWESIQNIENGGMELSCRQNYHMLVTDGYWNSTSGVSFPSGRLTSPSYKADTTLPKDFGAAAGRAYSASSDYTKVFWNQDTTALSPTMADLAFYYWATDLRTNLDNRVSPYLNSESVGVVGTAPSPLPQNLWTVDEVYFNPVNDPATWQHLVQFMVGLGVPGNLTQDDATLLKLRKPDGGVKWPTPTQVGDTTGAAQQAKIDDTWHAAINSRGKFFNAGNPTDLVKALTEILSSIALRRNSASALSVSSSVVNAGSVAYSTGYDSASWTGSVLSNRLMSTGARGALLWDAGCLLTGGQCASTGTSAGAGRTAASRQILTSNSPTGGGVAFTWDSLSAQQQTWLNKNPATGVADDQGNLRVEYIRGDRTQEAAGASPQFRVRNSLLGAVVNSSAVYHSLPSSGYRDIFPENSPEANAAESGDTYEKFAHDNKDSKPVVYVGANDGMLHAFDAADGTELWAYVPYAVSENLNKLTATPYKFQPFVDNSPEIFDVFTEGAWRSLLVGTLRMGGRGVYALDVTDPEAVTQSGAGNAVKWEFSGYGGGDADHLGYTFGQPNVARLRNGKWAVLVPAGYFQDPDTDANDPTSLMPAATADHGILFVLDAEDGSVITRMETPSGYGLATAVIGSYGRDQMADFAVAGDLVGNLWRFDLTDLSTIDRIFQPATDGDQPITVMPQLFPDTTTQGVIAVFGTGKYLGLSDRETASMPVQSYYGVREYGKGGGTATVGDLVQQTLTVDSSTTYRSLTGHSVPADKHGWYFNLDKVQGERNVLRAGRLINSNRAVLESLIPAGDDPCDPSIKGALMIIDAATGGPPSGPPPVGGGPALPGGSTQVVGLQVSNPPITGAPPMVTLPGGGQVIIPGTETPGQPPVSVSDSYWRRRSWRTLSDGL